MEDFVLELGFQGTGIPARYTCDGDDISPLLRIHGIRSRYLAIIVDDRVRRDHVFTHWLIWDIPAQSVIPENIPHGPVINQPFSAFQGVNDFGTTGYSGPCPPLGEVHTYTFRIFGLDTRLDVRPGSNRDTIDRAMSGHTIQYGKNAVATYRRQ